MPEYLAPGIFIEEIERGPKPIEGVATSTTAFLGETERGPTKPQLVTSYGEYLRIFGDVYEAGKYVPYAAKAFFDNGGRRAYIARIVGDNARPATLDIGKFHLKASGPGAAYTRVWARIDRGSTTGKNGAVIGFRLRLAYWDRDPPAGTDIFDPVANGTKLPRPTLIEDFNDLSLDPASPSYWDKRVNHGNSSLVEIAVDDDATVDDVPDGEGGPLVDGANGDVPGVTHFEGVHAEIDKRTGLAALALDPYRDVAIVAAPGQTTPEVLQAVITHCELERFRIAVLDGPQDKPDPTTLDPRTDIDDTKYAAFYYPWIVVSDPRTGARVEVPPSGAVCGIYALTDNSRGVWKAPANETVAGALDLKYQVDTGAQEILNPRGVNCIRRFPGRGIRVWGARTLSSDPLWKYVNVRRLFIFLEASIYYATQWVVFEPNDPRLWARVKQTVTLFLRTQWREGALFGEKEEEAFHVAIGRDTMTEDDILNGRLIIEIGIAPVRPAEFVIFRVYQKTQEAKE
ncbi:MAG: phage tail sheath family protein [Sphingomonas sp.]|uniref:phage tail sheath family protein n=1 Tax=Sphingomonas sp. TaxID=28214 RepID=UPI0025D99501|nr:phage tail sheath family protein [Sphingomonas sp.]MBQ1500541.1 phage tail sheath family protein [Sphingomonas sp.]